MAVMRASRLAGMRMPCCWIAQAGILFCQTDMIRSSSAELVWMCRHALTERAPSLPCRSSIISRCPLAWKQANGLMSSRLALFEVRLKCVIEAGAVGRYPRVEFSLLDEEQQELELQYKNRKIFAIGHGCAVDWQEDQRGVREIRSEFMPVVEVPQVTADVAGGDEVLNLAWRGLKRRLSAALRRFVAGYDGWIAERTDELGDFPGDERKAGERIVRRMNDALARMQSGIALIERTPDRSRFCLGESGHAGSDAAVVAYQRPCY